MLPLEPIALTAVGALGLPRPAAAMLAAAPAPLRLRARIVKDTVSPFVKPGTTSETPKTNVDCPPHSAMYTVTAAPPVLLGAPHVSVTTPSPSATCKFVGALAVVAAVATTGEEAAPPPTRLTANTFAVMALPLVRPVNVARFVAAVIVPPVYSTMYAVIAAPPLSTWRAPLQSYNAVAVLRLQTRRRGGRCCRRCNTTSAEAAPRPPRLTANTFAVMALPLVSPVNVARVVAAVIVPPVYSTM